MSKSKSKPVVRGPQMTIKALGRAAGTAAVKERTRMLYAEPPQRVTGNPFLAVRVPRELLAAFKAYAKKKDTTTNDLVRRYMSKVTGVSLTSGDDSE